MTDKYKLQHGFINENNNFVNYEIPKEQTELVDIEQLNELKKNDSLFFECQHYTVEEKMLRFSYKKPEDFKALNKYPELDTAMKQKIASKLLSVKKIIGTQYTALIHPDNIYINENGDVKFAHRGIRAVLPPKELTSHQLINEMKIILLYLFSSYSFADLTAADLEKLEVRDPGIKKVIAAESFKQLEHALKEVKPEENPKYKKPAAAIKEKVQKPQQRLSLLSGLLLGILIGMMALYFIKVVPLTEASTVTANNQSEKEEKLANEKEELKSLLETNRKTMHGYRSALVGDTEEAIVILEGIEKLDESANRTLIEQYIKLNSVDSLTKAASLSEEYHSKILEKLKELKSEEANQAILDMKSDLPEVKIQQAWLNSDYKKVTEIFNQNPDVNNGKFLAAKSYIELKNHEEALKLGKELKNKEIEIDSLELKKSEIEKNNDMEKEEKEEAIKKLDEKIKKLKD